MHRTGLLTVMVPSAEALETVVDLDQQLRRRVRPRRRRRHLGDAEVGHQPVQGQRLLLRQHRRDAGEEPVHRSHAARRTAEGEGRVSPGRLHARRADHAATRLFFFGDYIRTNDDLGRVNRFVVPTAAMRNGDFSASSVPIFDPLTGDQATGANRTQFAEQPDSGQPHQPDRAAHPREHSAAEHRRAARPGELSGHHHARAPHRRLRRQDQLSGVVEGSALRPLQLPASDGVRAVATSGATSAGPSRTASSARHEHDLQRRRQLDAHLEQHAGDGRARRRQHVSQRRHSAPASGLRTAADLGIPGREPRRVHERHDAHRNAERLEPTRSRATRRRCRGIAARRRSTMAVTMTKLWGNHTIKFGGDYRHNEDYLLQTQDQGGPRGRFQFGAEPDRIAGQRRVADQPRELVRGVPARSAQQRQPRPRGHRQARHGRTRRSSRSSTTSGRSGRR